MINPSHSIRLISPTKHITSRKTAVYSRNTTKHTKLIIEINVNWTS